MKFAIYSRKSIDTGKGESIGNQIEMCKQYILSKFPDTKNSDIFIYEDEGFSGKNLERPNFQTMMNDIQSGKIDCMTCYRLDRTSRNVSDFSTLIETLNNFGVNFISIKEDFDTTKPMGKAMMYIASVFSQLERETIAERVRDNMLLLAKTGRWLGGTTPTGFTSEKYETVIMDGKLKTAYKLIFNSDEINIVKTIYQKFWELRSISAVSKYLIHQNIKSRNGKFFSLLGIKEVLKNPVYCTADKDARNYFLEHNSDVCFDEYECSDKYGLLSYNKRDYRKNNTPRRDMSEWIIAKGQHKGIVSGERWTEIQNILELNKPSSKSLKSHNDYSLLSGMIICKKCGQRMFAKMRSNNKNLFDYICNNKMRGGTDLCDCPNLNGMQVDDAVCDYLLQYTNVNSNIYSLLEKLKSKLKSENPIDSAKEIDNRITKITAEINTLLNRLSDISINQTVVKHITDRIEILDSELSKAKLQKEDIESKNKNIEDNELQLDILSSTLSNFKNSFNFMSMQEKRNMLRLLIQKIEWDGKDLHIFICGE